MIHTVNHKCSLLAPLTPGTPVRNDNSIVDLSAELTRQLQRMIRQGQYYKLVGIDLTVDPGSVTDTDRDGGLVSGKLNFFQPTRGRCMAYRNAYHAVTSAMRDQGINYRADDMYDFRVAFQSAVAGYIEDMPNVATLDGTYPLLLRGSNVALATESDNIFSVHNSNIAPASSLQTSPIPFGTYGNTSDFRLNEEQPFSGNADAAHLTPESIPFTAAYDADSEEFAVSLDWRPDPALFLPIMCGLFQIELDGFEGNSDSGLELNFAFHIAGWTSIMGDPDKKKKTSKRSSRGKKRSKK